MSSAAAYMSPQPQSYPDPDTKLPLSILMRLQAWISNEFKALRSSILTDVHNAQYLKVVKTSPHPLLLTQPSVQLVCRVREPELDIGCQLFSFNSQLLREVRASFDDKAGYDDLRSILSVLDTRQTSICRGIPEEKLICWVNRKNISQIFIERFMSKVRWVGKEQDILLENSQYPCR